MRLYTVSAIESWVVVKGMGKKLAAPKLGKNGGPLCVTRGMISSYDCCKAFVDQARLDGCVTVSEIRKWRGR